MLSGGWACLDWLDRVGDGDAPQEGAAVPTPGGARGRAWLGLMLVLALAAEAVLVGAGLAGVVVNANGRSGECIAGATPEGESRWLSFGELSAGRRPAG